MLRVSLTIPHLPADMNPGSEAGALRASRSQMHFRCVRVSPPNEKGCSSNLPVIGTIVGCLMSYIVMQQITTEKRDILMSIQGTNIWSGQKLQTHNSAVRSLLSTIHPAWLTLTRS